MKRSQFLKLCCLGLAMPSGLQCFNSSASSGFSINGSLSSKQTLQYEGRSRSYLVYTPAPRRTTPSAVVLLLHGHGGSANQIMGLSGKKAPFRLWMPIADRENLILIIPDGLVSPDGKQGWNDARNIDTNPNSDDVGFLTQLIETVAQSYPIDLNRIYATGTSNGGQMALRLAAERSKTFAAIAAIIASNPDPIFPKKPQHPISVMLVNGTKDRFIPYQGGDVIQNRGKVQSTHDSIQYWVDHNECQGTPRHVQYPNRSRRDRTLASKKTYRNSNTNTEVSLIRILGDRKSVV